MKAAMKYSCIPDVKQPVSTIHFPALCQLEMVRIFSFDPPENFRLVTLDWVSSPPFCNSQLFLRSSQCPLSSATHLWFCDSKRRSSLDRAMGMIEVRVRSCRVFWKHCFLSPIQRLWRRRTDSHSCSPNKRSNGPRTLRPFHDLRKCKRGRLASRNPQGPRARKSMGFPVLSSTSSMNRSRNQRRGQRLLVQLHENLYFPKTSSALGAGFPTSPANTSLGEEEMRNPNRVIDQPASRRYIFPGILLPNNVHHALI